MEEASQNSRGRLPLSPVFLCLFSSSSGPTPSTARWPRRRPPPTPPTGQSDSQAPVGWEAWGWGWGAMAILFFEDGHCKQGEDNRNGGFQERQRATCEPNTCCTSAADVCLCY